MNDRSCRLLAAGKIDVFVVGTETVDSIVDSIVE